MALHTDRAWGTGLEATVCGPGSWPAAPPGMAGTRKPWDSMDGRVRRTTWKATRVRAGEASNHSLRCPIFHLRQSPPSRRKRHQQRPADKSTWCRPAEGGRLSPRRWLPLTLSSCPSLPAFRAHRASARAGCRTCAIETAYVTVCGVVLRRRWVWSFRHPLRRTLKHSNTEPLLPALPPHYHRLRRKLPSSRSCPLRGRPAPPRALKRFAEPTLNERTASPVGASQSVVRIGHSYSCTTNGKGHLKRWNVANLGISTKDGSHSGTHCVFRTRGKSNRLKATQCCFAGFELIGNFSW